MPSDQAASLLLQALSRQPIEEAQAELLAGINTALKAADLSASVEILKSPLCVGEPRRLVLNRAEELAVRKFMSRWDLTDWLNKEHSEIDLSAPPKYLLKK